jgi:hypothetical protein
LRVAHQVSVSNVHCVKGNKVQHPYGAGQTLLTGFEARIQCTTGSDEHRILICARRRKQPGTIKPENVPFRTITEVDDIRPRRTHLTREDIDWCNQA